MTGDERHLDHDALRDDLAAYALDALPRQDADELARHLEGCSSCRELLHWLQPAVDVLPAAVPQRTPPASLRENLLAAVRVEAAENDPHAAAAAGPHKPSRRRFTARALRPATALAATLILVAGVAGGYLLRGDAEDRSGSPARFVEAAAPGGNPDASATLELYGDSAMLHVNELPELARDSVYQVWIQRAGVMEPATLFVLKEDGSGVAAVPGPLIGAERVLVTAEPVGGSQRPTSPPLLAAALQ